MTDTNQETGPQNPKTVLLATPCGADGSLSIGTVRGLIMTADSPHRIHQYAKGGSLLTYNFNQAWCAALNGSRGIGDRPKFTHFVMMHSDIQPIQPDWLNILLDELDASRVDVLSVIAPLKNANGLTSTAIDTNRWRPRRLTMTEVHKLPETFMRQDLMDILLANDQLPRGAPCPGLLINTGLMVIRLDSPCWDCFPGFHINDQIGINAAGEREPHVEPEDWNFSRWCNLPRGGKENTMHATIAATRKVQLAHQGAAFWNNTEPWGLMETDEINTPEALEAAGLKTRAPGS